MRQAQKSGISESTLRKAKKILGVEAVRIGQPGESRGAGIWMWKMLRPGKDD